MTNTESTKELIATTDKMIQMKKDRINAIASVQGELGERIANLQEELGQLYSIKRNATL